MMRPKELQRIPVTQEAFRNVRWVLQTRGIWFIAGLNSLYVPSRNEKYLVTHKANGETICRDWKDLSGQKVLMSPGEAARTELRREFQGIGRLGWQPQHIKLLDWRWPMYYAGPIQSPKGFYIDLKGAYHALYSKLWLDCSFPCGYGNLDLAHIAHRLYGWKGARNSLMGVIRSRVTTGVRGFKTVQMSAENPFLSPHLWATVQACLNEIANVAIQLGAVYVVTDGYIFVNERKAAEFQERLSNWGLPFRTVKGTLDINGWGSYRVGIKETKNYAKNTGCWGQPFLSVNIPDTRYPTKTIDWWKYSVSRYRKLNERGNDGDE